MATLGRLKSSSSVPLITMSRVLVFILSFLDLSSGSQRSPRPHLRPSQCGVPWCCLLHLSAMGPLWLLCLRWLPMTLPASLVSTLLLTGATAGRWSRIEASRIIFEDRTLHISCAIWARSVTTLNLRFVTCKMRLTAVLSSQDC